MALRLLYNWNTCCVTSKTPSYHRIPAWISHEGWRSTHNFQYSLILTITPSFRMLPLGFFLIHSCFCCCWLHWSFAPSALELLFLLLMSSYLDCYPSCQGTPLWKAKMLAWVCRTSCMGTTSSLTATTRPCFTAHTKVIMTFFFF